MILKFVYIKISIYIYLLVIKIKNTHLNCFLIDDILIPKGGKNMLNQSILVGRIVRDPEVRETESGNKVTNITLAVQRPYKNINGEYDTDFISCVLWKGVAETTAEYCKKGDLIGIRGRIQTRPIDLNDENRHNLMEIIAERVTFLSSKRIEAEE